MSLISLMSIFATVETAADVEQEKDVLGGSFILDTDVYDATIKLAYAGESKRGSKSLTIHADINGKEVRHTFYVTNKQGQNFYVNKKTDKKEFLPGWNAANALCLLIADKELPAMVAEEKIVKLYDFDAKAEVPTKVQALTELHGGRVKLAIEKQLVDVNQETAPNSGVYVPSGKTREQNEIVKVFYAEDGRTTTEIRNNVEQAEFLQQWVARNKGKISDRTDKKAGTSAGAPGVGGGILGQAQKPANSLFGAKA
ncbi:MULTISPECIES: hypothetical protein [Pantoea]|jgi:hypothetical protein|uniref:Single-stranded DNA-binding protein n=3 Tax=Pantoea brenneri TaxID=472694 RepID=A0A7Y6TTM1_9GAMM|nr:MULTISPECIES: hypothetical protein [Pantoea]MBZ6396969.1 hypothetical protein [Pantoea sp.]MBZ6440280.1 hypothetical protein [Pantoea sp.]NUY43455.1 hypothetical protein [Pantoea brenneri]NUY50979.1 hypothetical protein [Pantoea brenneri]NUY61290.1 hypothetical protein [Pantoea brenneri]